MIEKTLGLLRLPPLDNLRFFESAARHESFARAAAELGVTPGAVAHRVRTLENSLDTQLFERHQRGVVLSNRGRSYLKDVQRILEDIYRASEDLRRKPHRLRIISIEAIAEKWLIPRLGALKAAHPDITVELDTSHHSIDASGRDFDTWIAYTGETAAPRPVTGQEEALIEETLYEENLIAVCSPALLAERGRPSSPADLHNWPLVYALGWENDWDYWSACQNQRPPDLSRASAFRLYSMVVDAALSGLGVAIGRPALIERELEEGTLVPVLNHQNEAPRRCCLFIKAAARKEPQIQSFRRWILGASRANQPFTIPGNPGI